MTGTRTPRTGRNRHPSNTHRNYAYIGQRWRLRRRNVTGQKRAEYIERITEQSMIGTETHRIWRRNRSPDGVRDRTGPIGSGGRGMLMSGGPDLAMTDVAIERAGEARAEVLDKGLTD